MKILDSYVNEVEPVTGNKISESLYANDYKKLQRAIEEYMDKTISFYDIGWKVYVKTI